MDINEIKKDLYKSKAMAKFSHYQSGELFYTVQLADGIYQFPIETVLTHCEKIGDWQFFKQLSSDLGSTPFWAEIRGSELIRWMTKAIDKEAFIKIQ